MDVLQALERLGGAGRSGELTHTSRRALLRAVERGEVVRPARGVFALPRCDRDHLAAVLVDGALTCASAARAHGLELLEPPGAPHVRCPRGSRLTHPRAVVHRRRPAGARVVDVLTAVLDCARCLSLPEAVAVCDSALRRGLLDADDLAAPVGRLHRADPRARLVAHADARSDSLLESIVRVELRERGLRVELELQVAHDEVGRVDLLVDGWLVVELDGYAFHADRAAFRLDRRRGVELARQGRVVLRSTYEDVLRRREWLVDAVVDVLAAGRPPFAA
ncbi:hypothetical protein MN205_10415 [Kineococcus sp. TRM81007]|uniref:hypothetical protein n=1 Tax=Kineococcus sp. TRM81007 TaxID=2925831 RepID=UPI001F564F42|nr:hypothetical protein [Kineococcus sp. TRM81007]MCI2238907.1 hypothetical protein [Kineococcus sp. TRM81007]